MFKLVIQQNHHQNMGTVWLPMVGGGICQVQHEERTALEQVLEVSVAEAASVWLWLQVNWESTGL